MGRHKKGASELSRSRRGQIKDAQLCRAVRETLSLTLAESLDPRLEAVFVVDVVPAPDVSRLAVRVEAPSELDPDDVHDALERTVPRLRSEIAAAIQRKKTPGLTFVVVPAGLDDEQ